MFTREQIEELAKSLQSVGAKDSSFPLAEQVNGDEELVVLKDRLNQRIKLSEFYQYIADRIISKIEESLKDDYDEILKAIEGITPDIEELLKTYFTATILPQIQAGFTNILGQIQSSQEVIVERITSSQDFLDSKIQEVLDSLKFTEILTAISQMNTAVLTAISNLQKALDTQINTGFSNIRKLLGDLSEQITAAVNTITESITTVHEALKAQIEAALADIKSDIASAETNIIDTIEAAITAAQTEIINNDNSNTQSIIQRIAQTETVLSQAIADAYNNLLSRLNRVEENIQTAISSSEQAIKESVTSAQKSLGEAIAEVQNVLSALITSSEAKVTEKIDSSRQILENRIKFTQDWLEQWWDTMVTLKVTCQVEDATILINNNGIPQITVPVGSNVNVDVSADGYYRFNEIVNVWRDTTLDIILENKNPLNEVIIEVHPIPQNATVTLDGENWWRKVVVPGSVVHVKVEAKDYITYEKDVTVNNDTILNVVLDPVQVPFTVNAQPEGCTILINGEVAENGTAMVDKNSTVHWEVSKEGYATQEGDEVADEDNNTIDVTLQLQQITITIAPVPSDSSVIINEVARNSITVPYGTEISYTVSHTGYLPTSGTHTAVETTTIDVVLERNYVILPDAQLVFLAAGETKNMQVQSNTSWIFR